MTQNSTLAFAIQPLSADDQSLSIVPVLDGIHLTRMIEEFERINELEPAGGYAGLVPKNFKIGPLDAYFMGQTDKDGYPYESAGYFLLGCSCGEVGCWPLTAKFSRAQDQMVWDCFRQPHRPARDYSSFGPFTFDLDQYRQAVGELTQRFPT